MAPDAKARGVELPEKFTPKGGTESYFAWRAELEGFDAFGEIEVGVLWTPSALNTTTNELPGCR